MPTWIASASAPVRWRRAGCRPTSFPRTSGAARATPGPRCCRGARGRARGAARERRQAVRVHRPRLGAVLRHLPGRRAGRAGLDEERGARACSPRRRRRAAERRGPPARRADRVRAGRRLPAVRAGGPGGRRSATWRSPRACGRARARGVGGPARRRARARAVPWRQLGRGPRGVIAQGRTTRSAELARRSTSCARGRGRRRPGPDGPVEVDDHLAELLLRRSPRLATRVRERVYGQLPPMTRS